MTLRQLPSLYTNTFSPFTGESTDLPSIVNMLTRLFFALSGISSTPDTITSHMAAFLTSQFIASSES